MKLYITLKSIKSMYYIGNLGILAHNVYYEPSSEQVTTKRGNINPAPRNPEEVLKSSIPISENSTRRIGVDYDANEFIGSVRYFAHICF